MSTGSQGSINQGMLSASRCENQTKNRESIGPSGLWIPPGSISSDNSNQKLDQPVGSDTVACSVDRIQRYIKDKCPAVYEYTSSRADYSDSRTKACLEEIGIDPDRSCSVLESDIKREYTCDVFCRVICLPGKNRPENFDDLPDYCKPDLVAPTPTVVPAPTIPVTSATIPLVTTKVTSTTTINAATESDSGNTLAIGLGAGLGGLLLIVLVILGIYCFKNRKRGEILEYYKPF